MKITQKCEVTYTIELTQEELDLFMEGIGNTSIYDRERIGMTKEQSEFFTKIYHVLDEV
jgi:hypothetical protein